MLAKFRKYLLSFCIFLAVLEASLFLIVYFELPDVGYPGYSIASAKPFWRETNSDFGVWHPPNSKFRHYKNCFDAEYRSNSHGMRDAETEQDSKSRRVVVLGDSFVEGYGVDYGDRFTEVLDTLTGTDHLNFGTSRGFGITASFVLYETMASKFSHDAVILSILPNNDFVDDDPKFRAKGKKAKHRPYLFGKYPNYEIGYSRENFGPQEFQWGKFLENLVPEFWLTFRVGRHIRRHFKDTRAQKAASARSSARRPGSYYFDYSREQFNRLRFAVGRIKSVAGDRPMLVFTVPRHDDFERSSVEEKSPPLRLELEKLSGELGFDYVDLLSGMAKAKAWKDYFMSCNRHWNPKGHLQAAETLSNWNFYSP